MNGGKKVWYFADGYLPEKVDNGPMEAHEALMLFNTNARDAKVTIDVYFSDRDPIRSETSGSRLRRSASSRCGSTTAPTSPGRRSRRSPSTRSG